MDYLSMNYACKHHQANEHSSHSSHSEAISPKRHDGHDHHAMMIHDFRRRFFIVLALTIPVMLLSPMIQHWLNMHWQFSGSAYILATLSSIVFFYGGWPFLKGWFSEMKAWKPGMM